MSPSLPTRAQIHRAIDQMRSDELARLWEFILNLSEERVAPLPPALQKEVEDFARFLLERHAQKRSGKLRQDWAGALREHGEQYTSLELQKKALEWRGG